MKALDYDIADFLVRWGPSDKHKMTDFASAVRSLVEKVKEHGFKLGCESAGEVIIHALDKAAKQRVEGGAR